jgi:outer membrane protein OmpA-like peptidoglycan-associated protein
MLPPVTHPHLPARLVTAATALLLLCGARDADAQSLRDRLRSAAAGRAAEAAAKAAAGAARKRAGVADSARPAAAAVPVAASAPAGADAGAVDDAEDVLRIPLHGVVFTPGADTLDLAARAYVREFARGLPALGSIGWTVQVTLPPSGDAARDRARAERRAAVVRAAFVGAGVPAAQVAAVGRVADVQTAPDLAVASVFLVQRR